MNISGSNGTTNPVSSEGRMAPPAATSRPSSRLSAPCTAGSPGPWSAGIRSAARCAAGAPAWVWNDISGMTSAAVALPPRNPKRSTRITSAPASRRAHGGAEAGRSAAHHQHVALRRDRGRARSQRNRARLPRRDERRHLSGSRLGPAARPAFARALGEQAHRDLVSVPRRAPGWRAAPARCAPGGCAGGPTTGRCSAMSWPAFTCLSGGMAISRSSRKPSTFSGVRAAPRTARGSAPRRSRSAAACRWRSPGAP